MATKNHTNTDNQEALKAKMSDLMAINPLIDDDGDTTRVRSVLRAISALVDTSSENGSCTLDSDVTFGVMVMLRSCCAALEQMEPIHAP